MVRKLDSTDAHILHLVEKGKAGFGSRKGWTSVNSNLYIHLKNNIPEELVEFLVDENTDVFMRMTEEGEKVYSCLKWFGLGY